MRFDPSSKLRGMLIVAIMVICPVCLVVADANDATTGQTKKAWQKRASAELALLGHRNWIVVVDSAYPAQSRAGIETMYIGGDQIEAVSEVLNMVDRAKHVRSIVYLDEELKSVPDQDAPGVETYRRRLKGIFGDRPVHAELHESIIAKLDEAAKTFRIVILKTDCTIPYTSVFIQLDCGYWSAEKEQRLRESLGDTPSE